MDSKDYELEFFKSNGFQRRQCKSCGKFFWTLGENDTCGEAPCVEYTFIGKPLLKEKQNVHEMRESFLSFLEKNGHTRVSRYPITARWRDDVFFTQASIYGFQPWVIQGVVEPPANPLGISQTCVRFNDIDNVGKTGSHLTMFEMMAHHVFNKKGKEIYWKDRTTELCHEFLTKVHGLDPKVVNYSEAWWEGGGNAGPCLEVLLGGVEVATLVFMSYAIENGQQRPMDIQVVDTGYGLERLTWISQGTPSAYEAVFGDVLEDLKRLSGTRAEERTLAEYSKVAGKMKIETAADVRSLRADAAARLGMGAEEFMKQIRPLESIYVVCDHTRALMFMLSDGVVPSNVRQGYFARLLVRRALREMSQLGIERKLSEIVAKQVDYFSHDFPDLRENKDEIIKLVDVEQEKYRDTLVKGRGIVQRLEGSSSHRKMITEEDLIELYDSHGLNPEVVADFASGPVAVPDDFYQKVAARHSKVEREEIETEIQLPKGLPATKLLFYKDPSKYKFRAKVLAVQGELVVLDKTYFYAESGGQESDTGMMKDMKVVHVDKVGNVVVHKVEGEMQAVVGKQITSTIEEKRRRRLQRHHTATHVINGAARKVLGNHIWQTGAHKGVDLARLDITHYADLTPEELEKIELLANETVLSATKVQSSFMERNVAEKRYGFRLYQGGAVPGKDIRVIRIGDFDVEACGGIHCKNTLEVGAIKILKTKRIQDGVVRLEFVSGMAAVEQMMSLWNAVTDASAKLNTTPEKINEAVERLMMDKKDLVKELEAIKKGRVGETVDELIQKAVHIKGVRVVRYVESEDMKHLVNMAKELIGMPKTVAVLGSDEQGAKIVVARSADVQLDCRPLIREGMALVGGSGGGKPDFAQGGGPDASKLESALDKIVAMVRETMEKE
ncbi:MAG: alanine--tRNA ligase [Thermoplasmatota archaeon]|nr:alanine--tRNA ligase [Candidatus Thermoplasmatota archaeon]MBU1915322.1 alanine--tRNA ligase [Candidatus Thermoplasmatota archaeon]